MVEGILIVLGLYGIGIAAVHAAWFIHHRPNRARITGQKPFRYILICRNQEHVIEWHLRSFLLYAWLKSEPMECYVLDQGSTDKTFHIIERFAGKGGITVIDDQTYQANPALKEHAIIIELSKQGETGDLPFPS